jgi:spermidine synthase
LAELAERPLDDPRVTVLEADVRQVIKAGNNRYDAILLDLDNGPADLRMRAMIGFTRTADWPQPRQH